MSSYFSTLLWGTSQLDDAVDKATSELLPSGSEDIALNLEISDQIRSKSVAAKDAMRAMKRRLNHKNPNVQLLALGLTDTCIKNGGDPFLVEIASREFMDNLVSILKMPALNHDVKNKILRLIQNWATAFEGRANLSYVGEVYKSLQHEGFNFPPRDPALTSSAMVDTQTAPEWIDSDVCLRCRTAFSFTNRKHHCRNCGQVFDQACSSKSMPLPHFGIAQEVRVCDGCYAKLTKKQHKSHRSSQSVSTTRHRSARNMYDAELQRAIQLSLEEVGASGSKRPGYVPSASSWQTSEPPIVDRTSYPSAGSHRQAEEEEDPDLRAAIEASLLEANAPKPSAPLSIETPRIEQPGFNYGYAQSYPPHSATPKPTVPALPNYDLEPLEEDAILTFSQTVDQLQQQGGRDLSRYPAVTELYDKANALRPKLAMSLSDAGRKEQLLAEMHEKLSEAVKLYDKHLTAQVTHPPWRTASAQPAAGSYAPQYQTQTSYGQWSIPVQPEPQMQAAQPSYFAGPDGQTNGVTAGQSATYAVTSPQAAPSEYVQYNQQAAPYGVASPPPVSIAQYQSYAPQAEAPSANHAPVPVQSPPPVQQYQAAPQHLAFAPPAVAPPPSQSPLARHNTVSAYNPAQQAAPQNQYLSRAKTLSHAPQQLQQLQQAAVPQQLPNFPVAPTAPPQAYQTYSSPAPVEPEREALLIDL
ncbi:ubiquitin binding protein [Phanerochaete sordida]|uniref:Vacuolar protein sorting-associated protein 27 n=1 Tax=Phanerochaete sordida TaxID=48140 RepID=A0A9P3GS16_9APHY|nr:ubiquitin binding protein [Phanerochaete sordida]